jgi:O-antigen/teichoic acid export membrane protein
MRFSVNPLVRRLGWGVADQVISSLTNFALGVLVARSVGAGEFGAFSLAYATYTLALGAARALALEPLVVRFSTGSHEEWKRAVAAAAGTVLTVGTVVGACCLIAASLAKGEVRNAFGLIGVALPGLLLQDAWRFSFFACGRGGRAFLNDLVWVIVLFPGAALLLWQGGASMVSLITLWALAGWVAAAVGLVQTGVTPRFDGAAVWLREHRDLAFRFFGEFLVSSGASQMSVFILGSIATLTDVAHLTAGQMVLGPLNIVFLGAGLVAVPETARLLRESLARMTRGVVIASVLLTLITMTWSAMALALPAGLGEWLLGANWQGGRSVLLPLTIGATCIAFSYGAMTGLRTLAAARLSLHARVLDAIVTMVLTVTGAAAAGGVGAAWGIAIAGFLRIPNWWWHFHRALSSHAAAQPDPTGVPLVDVAARR